MATYRFIISGMTCHACEELIRMDLEDVGFIPQSINHTTGEMVLACTPEDLDRVRQVIAQTKKYTVTNVTPHATSS